MRTRLYLLRRVHNLVINIFCEHTVALLFALLRVSRYSKKYRGTPASGVERMVVV